MTPVEKLNNTFQLLRDNEIVDFNLGDLFMYGGKVFTMGTIKREDMPQLRGFPIAGSLACVLPQDDKGKVDVTKMFLNWIARTRNAQILTTKERPSELRAAQSELLASKVAKHTSKLARDPSYKKLTQAYIVAGDLTLVDGQHGWASLRCHEIITGVKIHMNIVKVMLPPSELVDAAREFTSMMGISPKEGL